MPKYVFLFKAGRAGASNMLAGATEAAKAQEDSINALGGQVEAQYVVTGSLDMLLVADLPSDVASLGVSLAAESVGFYVEALRAFEREELDEVQKMFPDVVELVEQAQGADGSGQ